MSEWPSTYVSILVCSRPQCVLQPPCLSFDVAILFLSFAIELLFPWTLLNLSAFRCPVVPPTPTPTVDLFTFSFSLFSTFLFLFFCSFSYSLFESNVPLLFRPFSLRFSDIALFFSSGFPPFQKRIENEFTLFLFLGVRPLF